MADAELDNLPRSRQEAKLKGEKFYFTGAPCKRGHVAKQRTVNGFCWACEHEPTYRAKAVKRATEWLDAKPSNRQRHNDRSNERQKRLRQEDPEAVRLRDRLYVQNLTPEQRAARAAVLRAWKDKNHDHVRIYRNEWHKDWRQKEPEKARLKGRVARQRRRAAAGDDIRRQLAIDDVLAMLEAQQWLCATPDCETPDLRQGEYEIDHMVPVTRGGSNELSNLHILCQHCNSRKSTMSWDEFLARRSFLALLKLDNIA